MVNDAPGIDQIEGLIGEGKNFGIDPLQMAGQSIQRQSRACDLDGPFGQIDPVAVQAGSRPLQVISPGTDPDLQHTLTVVTSELRDRVDERLQLIAVGFDPLEPLATEFRHLTHDWAGGAAGLLVPIPADVFVILLH
jgi:hypothetical protein